MRNNDIFEETFKKIMDEESNLDAIQRFQKASKEAGNALVKSMPVWMRCNYLLNMIDRIPEESRDKIDWGYINEVLRAQNENFDFNIFDDVKSIEDLFDVKMRSTTAEIPEFNEPYFKKTCKCCKEEFTLTRGEINSYLKKSLKVPAKCYYCRKNIKKPIPVAKTQVEEQPIKTAMQIAMEKAGIK